MTLLNEAAAIRLGASTAHRVYAGSTWVWPSFTPASVAGLALWFDATLALSDERMLSNAAPTNSDVGDYTVGIRFTVGLDGKITHVRYWNPDASRSHRLSVWTTSDAVKRATVTDPPAAVGWREVALPVPLDVSAGTSYVVSLALEGGADAYTAVGPTSLSPHFTGLASVYTVGADVFPSTDPGPYIYHVDVVYRPSVVNPWPNLANASLPGNMFNGSPPVVRQAALNGLPVVRFARGQGRLSIGSGTGVGTEWTLVYVARMWNTSFSGRIATSLYPPSNVLVGWWSTWQDVMYDGSFVTPDVKIPATTDWKLYSGDGAGATVRLFSNGVLLGSTATGTGWMGTFALSGFDPSSVDERSDCEVAEVCLYNRKLADVERQSVEGYLRSKWGL